MYKLITHTDLDGIGCAILAYLAFRNNVDVSYCNYDDVDDVVQKVIDADLYEKVFITDISVSESMVEKINTKHRNWVLLDHHPTALDLNRFDWCTVEVYSESDENIKTGGTELFYGWLVSNGELYNTDTLQKFVSCVRDYDTYRWKDIGDEGIICKNFNDLFHLYGRDTFIDRIVDQLKYGDIGFSEADHILLNANQNQIDRYIEKKNKQMIKWDLLGKRCGVVFAEQYISELGNRLCEMHPEIDFVAIVDIGFDTVSYRTIRDNLDLGKDVASAFGGGGHPKAAGSQIPKEVKDMLIHEIFKKK